MAALEREAAGEETERLFAVSVPLDFSKGILMDCGDGKTWLSLTPDEAADDAFPVLANCYVDVLAKAETFGDDFETSVWYLVQFRAYSDPPASNMGWVPADMLEQYTAENMDRIVYPLSVKEGTPFYSDRECTRPKEMDSGFDLDGLELISGTGGESVRVSSGSESAYVASEALIYPEP